MRVVVIDSNLMTLDMHNCNFARGLMRDASRFGLQVRVVIPQAAARDVVALLGARAALTLSLNDTIMPDRWSWRIAEAMDGGTVLAGDLAGLDGDAALEGAVVWVPTAGPREMLGLALAIRRTGPPAAILLGFHHLRHEDEDPVAVNQVTGLHRYAFNRLQERIPAERIIVTATTGALAAAMAQLLGHSAAVYPHPIWYDLADPQPDPMGPPADGRLTFAVLGSTRPDKGTSILPGIADHAADLADRARLLVQVMPRYRRRGQPDLDTLLEGRRLVVLRRGALPESALLQYVEDAAAVLLPYDPAEYGNRASGIFAYAAAFGRPVIVPAGTWMAEQVERRRAAGAVVAIHAPFAYAAAMRRVLANLGDLTAAAGRLAPAWRQQESGPAHIAQALSDLRQCGISA